MNEVFIEYAIADNFIMDYILLRQTAVVTATPYKKGRIALCSALGTTFAIILPLFSINAVLAFFLKLSCGAAIAFGAVNHSSVRSYLKYFNVFLLFTFLLGGGVAAAFYFAGIKLDKGAYIQAGSLPAGVTLLAGFLLVAGVKTLMKKSLEVVSRAGETMPLKIKAEGKVFEVSAFFDSGNTVKEERSGLPVIFLTQKAFDKISLKIHPVKTGKVYFTSAGGYVKRDVYRTDYVIAGNAKEKKHAVFACLDGFAGNMRSDALIGREVL